MVFRVNWQFLIRCIHPSPSPVHSPTSFWDPRTLLLFFLFFFIFFFVFHLADLGSPGWRKATLSIDTSSQPDLSPLSLPSARSAPVSPLSSEGDMEYPPARSKKARRSPKSGWISMINILFYFVSLLLSQYFIVRRYYDLIMCGRLWPDTTLFFISHLSPIFYCKIGYYDPTIVTSYPILICNLPNILL